MKNYLCNKISFPFSLLNYVVTGDRNLYNHNIHNSCNIIKHHIYEIRKDYAKLIDIKSIIDHKFIRENCKELLQQVLN